MLVRIRRPLAAALLCLPPIAACGRDEPTVTTGGAVETVAVEPADPEAQRLRELAAAYFGKGSLPAARETLQPLLDREPPDPRDLIAAACIELKQGASDRARDLLERARKLGDESDALYYNLARADYYDADFAAAATKLERVHEHLPDDLATTFLLAQMHEEIAEQDGQGGKQSLAEAEKYYKEVRSRGVEADASRYKAATFRLARMLERNERSADAQPLNEENDRLEKSGLKSIDASLLEIGTLGGLVLPRPQGNRPSAPGALPDAGASTVLGQAAGMSSLAVVDVDDDCRLDLVLWGPAGLAVAQQGEDFAWTWRALVEGPVEHAVPFDLDNDVDGDVDLLYVQGGSVKLLRALRKPNADAKDLTSAPFEWTDWDRVLPGLPSPPSDVLAVDYDHEGDLDLLLVGEFGARLWRNDGAGDPDPAGVFTDATAESGLPTKGSYAWCLSEDFDTDQDVDLLLGGSKGWFLASNLRGGAFEDVSGRLKDIGGSAEPPLVADLDGDARPDLWDGRLHVALPGGGWKQGLESTHAPSPVRPAGARFDAADLDLNGSLDAWWLDGRTVHARLSVGLPDQQNAERTFEGAQGVRRALYADLDGDTALELAVLRDDGLELLRGTRKGNAVRLFYRGKKDNRGGVGSVIEVRAGGVYRRIYSRGGPQLVGVGDETQVDYVRVLWPNGVFQFDLRHKLDDRTCDRLDANSFQPEGAVGSCPFLYTWNGRTYEFITDVLGITPLGLPMAPGMLVPPDHDEYVLVKAEQWGPKDGVYELQFTEELREVTYLDRIRLDAIDHPAHTEVFPNELFCFPPFPDDRVHLIAAAHAPLTAMGSDGRDWASELAEVDGRSSAPFEVAPSQMLGLATPHTLELAFDPALTANAPQLRLVLTGWFYWTDASVNMASARDPGWEFVPPILQVPDGEGGWRDAGPPIGFPAGKTKSMVVDVTGILDPADPRVRIFTTLRLCWDQIRLSTDGALPPVAKHTVEASHAKLWRRGFSGPATNPQPNMPDRFEWAWLAPFPRWNPHPGRYTRLGDVLPLLGAVDDRFVILASGDALTVRFPADALPPVPDGFRRDFLVYLDGWAKDRDPNTLEAEFVEPLPFHGMSGYPYGPDESFPDTPEHRAWRREWNTREAEDWIPFQAAPGKP